MEADGAAGFCSDAPLGASLQLWPGDLERFADSAEAKHLATLEADAALVNELMWRGYAGPSWTRFASALAAYSVEVMRAWIKSGAILGKCRSKGARGLNEIHLYPRERDDALEIAGILVATALVSFREKVLVPGKWRAVKGASLKTFFVGHCLLVFPVVYKQWARDTHESATERRVDPRDVILVRPSEPSPAVLAELRRRLPALRSDGTQIIRVMTEMGYSHNDIARVTRRSPRAIEGSIYRLKKFAGAT